MKSSIKWKDIYNDNKQRRYSEITGIKKEDVEIESNPSRLLKEKSFWFGLASLIIIAIILYTFRNDLKIALIVIGFFLFAGVSFFYFNYYKLKCTKEGLYIKFGMQQGIFKYDKIKSIYISRFNDSSYLFSIRTYNIVIRYEDSFKRLKELFFDASFLNKEQAIEFINNFETKEAEEDKYVNFERFKLLKKVGKILLIVAFIILLGIIGYTKLK